MTDLVTQCYLEWFGSLSASWGATSGAGLEGTVLQSTGPESTVPAVAPGRGGAGLRRAGALAGQGVESG
jgi:hypothetical protein